MTDVDPGKRRSRRGWVLNRPPGENVPRAHSHRQPRLPWFITWAALALLCVAVGLLTVYVVRFNDYVEGRGQLRDAENRRLEQRIDQGLCDLLDQLPASALLDGPRHKYGCGPGLRVDQLPPAVRRQWQPASPPAAPTSPAAAAPVPPAAPSSAASSGASASRTVVPEQPVGPRPPGAPAPPRSPLDPLLCGLLPRLCSSEVP